MPRGLCISWKQSLSNQRPINVSDPSTSCEWMNIRTYQYWSNLLCWRRGGPWIHHWCNNFPACKATHGLVYNYGGRGGRWNVVLEVVFCPLRFGEHGLTGHMWTQRGFLRERKDYLTFPVGNEKHKTLATCDLLLNFKHKALV